MGMMEAHVDFNNAIVADPGDTHLLPSGKGAMAFDMNVGIAYQWKQKLTIGFAVPQVVNTQAKLLNQLNVTDYSNRRQFVGTASYEISIKDETYNIEPCVMIKSGISMPLQVDGSVMANYKRFVYLGLTYRMDYGFGVQAAVRISKVVTIGYGYEYPIIHGATYSQTKGTHEVILGLNFTKWMKNAAKTQKKLAQIDSIAADNDKLKKDVDSLRKDMDTAKVDIDSLKHSSTELKKQNEDLQKQSTEQQQKEKELRERLDSVQTMVKDSFETMAKEYRKHIKNKPAVNFPESVDKSLKAHSGDVYRLNKVEFDNNSSYLKKPSYAELDKLAEFLQNNPNAHIRVMGHTDYVATDEYNQWLSDKRAKRVYDYLVDKGIAADRMTYVGFGKKAPIADNSTEEGRARNRRVEIEVLK
jgi:outer membrane protein OmpA-like peptidoglycan-associated protein